MSEQIERRHARSETVDYSAPIEIHDSTHLRIELVPFYIGTDFAAKIIRYDKRKGWEQTAISIQPPAVRRLQEQLSTHLAVALEEQAGNYLVIRTDGSVDDIGDLDLATVARAIRQLLLTEGVTEQLTRLDLGDELLRALRTELRLRELRDAVAELANHLRQGTAIESVYQAWCETHSWAFGNAYVVNDTLRNISATTKWTCSATSPGWVPGSDRVEAAERQRPQLGRLSSQLLLDSGVLEGAWTVPPIP